MRLNCQAVGCECKLCGWRYFPLPHEEHMQRKSLDVKLEDQIGTVEDDVAPQIEELVQSTTNHTPRTEENAVSLDSSLVFESTGWEVERVLSTLNRTRRMMAYAIHEKRIAHMASLPWRVFLSIECPSILSHKTHPLCISL